MEVLTLFGTEKHKQRWLRPLLEGTIRSAFAMTEPAVASSDATNIELRMDRNGDGYLLNGRKWFASNAMHPNCRVLIVMNDLSRWHTTSRLEPGSELPLTDSTQPPGRRSCVQWV